jgi:heme exporter protein C
MKNWWKILAFLLLLFTVVGGFLIEVPRQVILYETIRNLYFHVPMWFSMIFLFLLSVIYSIKYLSSSNMEHDTIAKQMVNTGIIFGILGLLTGSIWAKYTWGAYWTNDIKLNGSAITMLVYFAYLILRSSMDEEQKRGRIAAVYNIFAFVMLIVFIGVLPRMYDSLHPGNGGNPAFDSYDLDSNMRLVFYPAVVGWILLSLWIANLNIRINKLKDKEE